MPCRARCTVIWWGCRVTPREYVEVVRERWRYIVACVILGLAAAAVAIYLVPREYAASVTVMLTPQLAPGVSNPGGASEKADISGQRIDIYEELLSSTRLTRAVITTLHLTTTPEALADRIAVTTTPNSVLLTATVEDPSADQATVIANTLADQFIKNVAQIEQGTDQTRAPTLSGKVFEAAQPPADLITPRPLLYLLVGLEIGLVLGLGAALLRHALDPRVRRRGQLEDVLRAPVLGVLGRDWTVPSLVMYGRDDKVAEAFRQLRTHVQLMISGRGQKVILVTSATSGEGRSLTTCKLGFTLAEAGLRVLILEADLRRPSIAKSLEIDKSIGLAGLLIHHDPVDEVVQPVGQRLDVLVSGPVPANPSELLSSGEMTDLLSMFRERYDAVLIDTAPVLPVTDAVILAQRVDGVVLVARYGHTAIEDLRAAKAALDAVSARVLGSVLTLVPRRSMRRLTGGKLRPPDRRTGEASMIESVVGKAMAIARPAYWSSAGDALPPEPDSDRGR
jgi:capsular exopolysaccharide synthesis family protein